MSDLIPARFRLPILFGVFLLLFSAVAQGGGFLSSIGERLGLTSSQSQGGHGFLEPDDAFMLSADVVDGRIVVSWRIADGYYLYRNMFGFDLVEAEGITLAAPELPDGKVKEDEFFGRMEVYYNQVDAVLAVTRDAAHRGRTPVVLEAKYQGCAEDGFCYPPMTRQIDLVLPPNGSTSSGAATGNGAGSGDFRLVSIDTSGGADLPAQDRIARSLAEGALWFNLAAFFGFGLLLAFTPCVLPMVPILSSLIIGQQGGVTTRRAFLLSLAFVLAMALTYTVAGVLAGMFGGNLQILFQNTWVILAFSAVFVALALSMFGFYQIQMPSSWQTRLSQAGPGGAGAGTYAGAGAMGFFSALIVGPCVAAPLAGILIYIGMSGDAVFGGVSLFALSLGMGLPLLIIGASAGKLLPKVGPWMNTIKALFGILMLGVALWLLERVIPQQAAMLFWAALLIGTAVWIGAFDRLERGMSGWKRLGKGAGLAMFIYGAVVFVGALTGGRDVLQPLTGSMVAQLGGADAPVELVFADTKGLDGLRAAVADTAAQGRPAMLFFHAEWCVDCKTMERRTFSDPAVQQALMTDHNAVLLGADVTANDLADQGLMRQYGLFGPPAVLFFDADGNELASHRLVGYLGARDFIRHIERAWP